MKPMRKFTWDNYLRSWVMFSLKENFLFCSRKKDFWIYSKSKAIDLLKQLHLQMMVFTYLRSNWTFWVRPVTQVAMAIMRVTTPKEAWTGTKAARNAAVAPSQHSRIMKLKNPTTNCKNPELCHFKDYTIFCQKGVMVSKKYLWILNNLVDKFGGN